MDGVMHPSVEQAIGRDRIRKAFKRYENNPADEHDRGIVRAVNADGSYEVLLDGDVQTARCAPYAKAMVGDRVIVVTTKDGENVLLGRLGGEIETIMPTIDERFEALETDYIVAEGTSGNWTWRKWASGVAECWGRFSHSANISTQWGSIYDSGLYSQSYPFSFVGDIECNMSSNPDSDASVAILALETASSPNPQTETPRYAFTHPGPVGTVSVVANISANGRWK